MMHSRRQNIRIVFKLLLVSCLPLCGMSWALAADESMLRYAIGLTVVCVIAAFGSETIATSTEKDVEGLELMLRDKRSQHAAELSKLDEQLDKTERIAKVLEVQNHDMRAELITTMVRKHHHDPSLSR